MSNYCWEEGTLDLPAAAVKTVKEALRAAANAEHTRVYEESRAWAKKHGARYRRALASTSGCISPYSFTPEARLSAGAQHALELSGGKAPTHEQVDKAGAPRATSRTNTFQVGPEATITFNGRQVTWSVPENNHADEGAHRQVLAQVFFRALNRVRWTRGSGGVIAGNSENNFSSRDYGRGANYIVAAYGPKGKQANGGNERRKHESARPLFRRTW
jgi:hypothetical protein